MVIYALAAIYLLIGIGFSARNYNSDSMYGKVFELVGACVFILLWPTVIGALLGKALKG